jgi:two-component system OmpR family response regulator
MTTRKRTVLVVDDSEICRETVRYVLQARGYEVVTVDSPFSFGSALSKTSPDLVLVDANMPALQGDKLVAVALQNGLCSCPIVFHSDRPAEELQALVRTSGAAGYIRKTSDPNELVLAVEDYLASASSRRPHERAVVRDQGPVSQRGPRPESGVFPSAGPVSTRFRSSKV